MTGSSSQSLQFPCRLFLHRLGFRYRIHGKKLPGKPDLVFPKHQAVVFVHGCFWHRHKDCARATMPSTRTSFWQSKFDRNVERDRTNQEELKNLGWRVILIWECEIGNLESRDKRLPRLASEIKDPQFSRR